jgi:hypothetical protein
MEATYKISSDSGWGIFRTVLILFRISLVLQLMNHLGPNELCISWKEFGLIPHCCRDTAFLLYFVAIGCGSPKTEFRISSWSFSQRQASMRLVYGDSFRSFGCSYSEIRTSEFVGVYVRCKKTCFYHSRIQDRNNQNIWNFHNRLFSSISVSVQSFKTKFQTHFSCKGPRHGATKYSKHAVSRQQWGINPNSFQGMHSSLGPKLCV